MFVRLNRLNKISTIKFAKKLYCSRWNFINKIHIHGLLWKSLVSCYGLLFSQNMRHFSASSVISCRCKESLQHEHSGTLASNWKEKPRALSWALKNKISNALLRKERVDFLTLRLTQWVLGTVAYASKWRRINLCVNERGTRLTTKHIRLNFGEQEKIDSLALK